MDIKTKRLIAKMGARAFEEAAFVLDTMRFPLVRKQYDRLINRTYSNARWLRVYSGQKPRRYKRIVNGNIVEV
jgi:hypothetical protein